MKQSIDEIKKPNAKKTKPRRQGFKLYNIRLRFEYFKIQSKSGWGLRLVSVKGLIKYCFLAMKTIKSLA